MQIGVRGIVRWHYLIQGKVTGDLHHFSTLVQVTGVALRVSQVLGVCLDHSATLSTPGCVQVHLRVESAYVPSADFYGCEDRNSDVSVTLRSYSGDQDGYTSSPGLLVRLV